MSAQACGETNRTVHALHSKAVSLPFAKEEFVS